MPLKPGQSLAHYRILRQIGQGGMGAVFLAEDTKLERQVALKVLPPDMAAGPDRLERFRREAKAVAALNHPHIVTIHSVEEEAGTHFLTMELVEGESLDHGLPPGGLPLPKVFDVGIALADALAAAHEKGIIHRDLKPANIMLTNDGRVKVLDFGLAKLAQSPGGRPAADEVDASAAPTQIAPNDRSLTDAGLVVGTVPYMSPEQVGGETVDARSDIFSLGVVLYELATGQRPFGGKNPAETISSILRDTPRPVTEARRDVPRHLGRIIDHCLKKEPRDRFQTARDVFNEMRDLCKEVDSGSAPISTASGATTATGGSRLWLGVAAVAAVVIATVAAFWLGGRRETETRPAGSAAASGAGPGATDLDTVPVANSLAVLPFADMSPDKDQEYFSDGLTEEILNALVKIPQLKVAGRTSSFAFKGKADDLRTIGERLSVANILEGSVRKSGDRVRITAQLVKAEDGFHLWSEVYDRELSDIFAIQGDVARRVAQALSLELLPGQERRLTEATTSVPAAHEAYLKGRFYWAKRTVPDLRKSIEYLEEAVALDDGYAEAWMGLSQAWIVLIDYDPSQSLAQANERAREAARRALALDPTLVEARAALGLAAAFEWDWETAETELVQVIEARPAYATARHWYAWVLVETGRYDQAIQEIRRARDLEPLSMIINSNVGQMLLYAGRYEEAITELQRCLEMDPRFPVALQHLGMAYSLTGRGEEALAVLEGLDDQSSAGHLANLARVHVQMGHVQEAEKLLKRMRTMEARFSPVLLASVLAVLGRTDEALAALEQGCAERNPELRAIRPFGMFFRNLESSPRFQEVLRCINLA